MKKYYLHDGTDQQGPFDLNELTNKKLARDTPIWYEGLEEWKPLHEIEELNSVVLLSPPLFKAKSAAVPSSENKSPLYSPVLPEKKANKNSTSRRLLVVASVVVLILIGFFIYNQIEQQSYQTQRLNAINAEEDMKAQIRNHITSYIVAERSDYTYSDLGGIYNLKISVTNNTNYLVENVKVRVIYIKANGEVWDSRFVDFNLLNPQTKSTINIPDTERGTSVKYEITSIKSAALGVH